MANLDEKKALLEAEYRRRKKRKKIVLSSLIGIVVIGIAFTVLHNQEPLPVFDNHYNIGHSVNYDNKQIEMTTVKAEIGGGKVKLPLADLEKDDIVWAQYDPNFNVENGQKGLSVMAFLTPAGRVITTVSFCEPCYSRQFHIEGNVLVCNTCGTRWYLANLIGIAGGCTKYPPQELKYTLDKQTGQIVIDEAELKSWHPRDYDPATTMGAAQ